MFWGVAIACESSVSVLFLRAYPSREVGDGRPNSFQVVSFRALRRFICHLIFHVINTPVRYVKYTCSGGGNGRHASTAHKYFYCCIYVWDTRVSIRLIFQIHTRCAGYPKNTTIFLFCLVRRLQYVDSFCWSNARLLIFPVLFPVSYPPMA